MAHVIVIQPPPQKSKILFKFVKVIHEHTPSPRSYSQANLMLDRGNRPNKVWSLHNWNLCKSFLLHIDESCIGNILVSKHSNCRTFKTLGFWYCSVLIRVKDEFLEPIFGKYVIDLR